MSPVQIKELRSELGLTQKEMAEIIGVANLTMSQYETGFRKPGPTVIIFFRVLNSLGKKRALGLVSLFRKAAREDDLTPAQSKSSR